MRRLIKHLFYLPWLVRRAFPLPARRRIEVAIADSEVRHGAEIRFAVEACLDWSRLVRGVSARERALEVFSELRVWDTQANTGVLIYLLLADRDVEIIADRGLNERVTPAQWEAICQDMETRFRADDPAGGVLRGIDAISRLLARQLPPSAPENRNELSDRPVLLG
jgi:uncharacterized membrane protein